MIAETLETFKVNLTPKINNIKSQLDDLVKSTPTPDSSIPNTNGGFFGGSGDSFIANDTTTKLYTGPVLGGKGKKTRRHKNKRHSYSRKSKKGLKNKFKRMFGFKGGQGEVSDPSLSVKPSLDSVGGTTNVKSQL